MVARGADDPGDAEVHRSQELVAVRRLDQAAGAGAVDKYLRVFRADSQCPRHVVGPELRAQRGHQQRVEHRFVHPAQPLDQRELGGLHDRHRGRLAIG